MKQVFFKEILSKTISRFVMWGTISIGIIGIALSIVALTVDEQRVKVAFSIMQYVFGALLPLWGTWIGTILAYYYSKENFESANKSVQQIVDKITSDGKLQSVKAKEVMIANYKLIYQKLGRGEDLSKFKLKEDCLEFLERNKIRRVIILNENQNALYVIHRDLISYFISTETLLGNPVSGYTLKDMFDKVDSEVKLTLENSVKFIDENASLLEAKNIMHQFKTCQDIFLTKGGSPNEPIQGWITNVTIAEHSFV